MLLDSFLNIFTNYLPYITIIVILILTFYIFYLHYKLSIFMRGAKAISLEDSIKKCIDDAEEVKKRNELISEHALSLDTRVANALRNAQTIRYKAFEVNGSNQSFSIALLNELGNGVVISSLHSRDRINTFAKPVENYESEYDLTEEEKEVIKLSKKEHKENK